MTVATVTATVLVGNPRGGSRTLTVAQHVTKAVRSGLAEYAVDIVEPDLIDLSGYGPALAELLSAARTDGGPVQEALRLVRRPGLVLVVSPTFKGTYTGLLKLFLDLLPREGLGRPCVAVPVMTAGWDVHRGAPDRTLRPLLLELGAEVPVDGLCVSESEFGTLDTAIEPWLVSVIPTLAATLRARICPP